MAKWRIHIDSAIIESTNDAEKPYKGTVKSSWFANGYNVKPEYRTHSDAFCIADELALVYRARAESWEGMSDTYEPAVARIYLSQFDTIWNACEIEPELRRMQI